MEERDALPGPDGKKVNFQQAMDSFLGEEEEQEAQGAGEGGEAGEEGKKRKRGGEEGGSPPKKRKRMMLSKRVISINGVLTAWISHKVVTCFFSSHSFCSYFCS